MQPCRLRGYKNIWGQSWRSQGKLPMRPTSNPMLPGPAEPADFLSTSNFDLWYFCSLLTYKNVQYLIWKIWLIYVWSLMPKALVWLLTGFMLGQSTLISYHTEANGCIFFAGGVFFLLLWDRYFKITVHFYCIIMKRILVFSYSKDHLLLDLYK